MLHIRPTKVRNEQREQHFLLWVEMIKPAIKVWYVIAAIFDRRQKIIMLFLAAQCSKSKKISS